MQQSSATQSLHLTSFLMIFTLVVMYGLRLFIVVLHDLQSNLRRKDPLGAGLLSFVRRLSLSRRFTHISITSLFNVTKKSF